MTSSNADSSLSTANAVELYVYDMSQGMANSLSSVLLGHHIDGIWHTAIVVYGREHFYGGGGIQVCPPGATILGTPGRVIQLGTTEIPREIFVDHLRELGRNSYRGQLYDLFTHNCNTFTNELSQFLVGTGIPAFILDLPQQVLNTPLGQILNTFAQQALLQNYQSQDGDFGFNGSMAEGQDREPLLNSEEDQPNSAPPEASGKKRRDVLAEVEETEEQERREREEKKKQREPPIVFKDLGNSVDELLDELEKSLANVELNEEEMRCLRELREYALGDEGSWVLSDDFLALIGRILLGGEQGIGDDSRVQCLKVLAWLSVTKDDVILVLHQDRKDHVIMRYASNVDQLSPQCQEAVALLLCNLFENLSTSEWLLYISEWESPGRGVTSNIRVTTKVGVHALLSKEFKDIGSALIFNLVSKEVKTAIFDDVAVEVALALLQFFSEKPPEVLSWRGLKALLRCCNLARSEVPGLIKMVGPPPSELKGASARCDELIDQINTILGIVSG